MEQTPTTLSPGLIDINEASAITGITIAALYQRVNRGAIPHRRFFGRVVFLRTELLGWLEQNGTPKPEYLEL